MMRVLRLVLMCVAVLIPSALYAQPSADGPVSAPVAATHLRESIPDAASAVVAKDLPWRYSSGWSAKRKGAVIGLVAGGIMGAGVGWILCEAEQADAANCAGGMFIAGAFFGGFGAAAGFGLGALIDAGYPSISHGTRLPSAKGLKRVSIGFRF